jgi:hypothetical protein
MLTKWDRITGGGARALLKAAQRKKGWIEHEPDAVLSAYNILAKSEDALTSCVFERLSYVEPNLVLRILSRAFALPAHVASFEHRSLSLNCEFWPRLAGTNGEVELDARLTFRSRDDIVVFGVECKFRTAQLPEQLVSECDALMMGSYEARSTVCLLALGGFKSDNFQATLSLHPEVPVYGAGWSRFREAVEACNNAQGQQGIVLRDILIALQICGFHSPLAFSSLQSVGLKTGPEAFIIEDGGDSDIGANVFFNTWESLMPIRCSPADIAVWRSGDA